MNPENKDPVKNPAHYTQGQYECWDAMEDCLSKALVMSFSLGCVFKYIWREDLKNSSVKDIEKAIAYLEKYAELAEIDIDGYRIISLRYAQLYPYFKSNKSESSVKDYFLIRAFDCLIQFYHDQDIEYLKNEMLIECLANLNAWIIIQNEGDI